MPQKRSFGACVSRSFCRSARRCSKPVQVPTAVVAMVFLVVAVRLISLSVQGRGQGGSYYAFRAAHRQARSGNSCNRFGPASCFQSMQLAIITTAIDFTTARPLSRAAAIVLLHRHHHQQQHQLSPPLQLPVQPLFVGSSIIKLCP